MALPGETLGLHKEVMCECGQAMPLQVCGSFAGYYLGYYCANCGPVSRETDYYRNSKQAQADLDKVFNGEHVQGR